MVANIFGYELKKTLSLHSLSLFLNEDCLVPFPMLKTSYAFPILLDILCFITKITSPTSD